MKYLAVHISSVAIWQRQPFDSSQFSAETNMMNVDCWIHICLLTLMKTQLSKPFRWQALYRRRYYAICRLLSAVSIYSLFRTLGVRNWFPLNFLTNEMTWASCESHSGVYADPGIANKSAVPQNVEIRSVRHCQWNCILSSARLLFLLWYSIPLLRIMQFYETFIPIIVYLLDNFGWYMLANSTSNEIVELCFWNFCLYFLSWTGTKFV